MNKIDVLIDIFPDEEFLIAEGFDDAIIGVTEDITNNVFKIVYSKVKCIEILIDRDGMSMEDAEEFFEFNVKGAYMGDKTPIWVYDDILLFNYE